MNVPSVGHALSSAIERRRHASAPRGQILVMFALFLTVLLGMLGLALDVGFAYAERRTVQNAADAAALAGARMVAKWSTTNIVSAQAEAEAMALNDGNRLGASDQTLASCEYVNYAGTGLGPCSNPVPVAARGVRVQVREEHDTFFIRVLPGAPDTVVTETTATANVQLLTAPTAGPFIVCGKNTRLAGPGNNSFSILLPDNTINPLAYGREYEIHGPQVEDCDAQGSSFKGTTVRSNANDNNRAGDTWIGDTGTQAGPTRFAVNGIKGCGKNLSNDNQDGCVMILPIATNSPTPAKSGNEFSFTVPQLGAFLVKRTGANKHTGTLLQDYVVTDASSETWCRTCQGVEIIRLTD